MTHGYCCRQIKKHKLWKEAFGALQTKSAKRNAWEYLYYTLFPSESFDFLQRRKYETLSR